MGIDEPPSADWIVRKKPTDTNTIEIINAKTGEVHSSGIVLYPLLQDLNDNAEFKDGHQILITPSGPNQSDAYKAVEGNLGLILTLNLTKDMTIWGYGARIRGGSTSHQSGGPIRQSGHQKSLRLFGLTLDASEDGTGATKRLGALVAGGDFDLNQTPKLIHLKDCRLLNVYNRGVHVETQSDGQGDCTILIENCEFSSGTTSSIQTFIGVNSSKYLIVNNCTFMGNNHVYSAAQNISFTNCFMSQNGIDISKDHGGLSLQGRNIHIANVILIHRDGISVRSYGTIHGGFIFDKAEKIIIKGCTVVPYDPAQTTQNVFVGSYNDSTSTIDECIISNCYFDKGKILVTGTSPTGAQNDQLHGKIKKLIIDNCYMGAFDGANTIATLEDHDFDYVEISNIKTPPKWPSSSSPVKLKARLHPVTVGYMKIIGNSSPQTSPEGYIVTLSDTDPLGQNISVVMDSPLSGGQNLARLTGTGAGTKTIKFLNNWGRATFSGDGSNLAFAIPHSLVSSPNTNNIRVSTGSAADIGNIHVTADSTNITVTFASGQAPASGTNNIVLDWYASTV